MPVPAPLARALSLSGRARDTVQHAELVGARRSLESSAARDHRSLRARRAAALARRSATFSWAALSRARSWHMSRRIMPMPTAMAPMRQATLMSPRVLRDPAEKRHPKFQAAKAGDVEAADAL